MQTHFIFCLHSGADDSPVLIEHQKNKELFTRHAGSELGRCAHCGRKQAALFEMRDAGR